ncbi:sensor domain-containing protein [Metabacillus sp. RGM 3146]|uniref:sensor domain-containing protein n=1 Tax=Metabacillus sp. RGM 3146 TaxID=3401092 RepID=UPI003B9CCF36
MLFYRSLRLPVIVDGAKIGTLLLFFLLIYLLFEFLNVKRMRETRYIIVCVFITLAILLGDYIGFYPMYAGKAEWNIVLSAMSFVIVFGFSLASVQLLYQILEETSARAVLYWKIIGGLFAGIALAGIPYMVIISVMPISKMMILTDHLWILLPYLLDLTALILLAFVPSYYSYRKLDYTKEKYESLFQHNLDAVIALDTEGKISSVNSSAQILTGYSRNELLGQSYMLISDRDKVNPAIHFPQALSGTTFSFEMNLPRKDHKKVKTQTSVIPIMADGKVNGVYCILKDITELKEAERKIHQLAYFDDSTQLPNQKHFKKMMESAGGSYEIMFISIDNLSKIADLYDEKTSEDAFILASERMKNYVSQTLILSRLDSSTFCIAYKDGDWETVLKNMIKELEKPISIKSMEINLSCKAGVVEQAERCATLEDAFRFANIALKVAKSSASSSYVLYQNDLNDELHKELVMETELRKAILNEELIVFYQPKFHLPNQQYNSAEALVRWMHPEMGMISPGVFIPIAEKAGLIKKLEETVLNQASKQMKKWLQEGYPFTSVAVNFSHYHFYDETMVETVSSILQNNGLDPSHIEIEITESSMIENRIETIKKLDELRNLGIKISLDDFGTGFSSLSYLQDLPLDTLKIDRSFIQRINSNEQSNAIISSIISLAGHLNLEVVAEGVETEEQLAFLERFQCPSIQGFFYSPPVPVDKMDEILDKLRKEQSA